VILACGAWLKNTACLLEAGVAHWSETHGDLSDPEACRRLEASLHALARAARAPVTAVAHDLHPDFFSSRIGIALAADWNVPAIGVQHHHAHIAAVLAEHGVAEPVIGLALDGFGLGSDGGAWGGELLWVGPDDWKRMGSLWPLALPGGDAAAREPWRMAAAALHALGAGDRIEPRFGPAVGAASARGVQRMLASGLNCPPTSSAGRWFDAAAGALGLCLRQQHEAQAAMALENEARRWLDSHASITTLDIADPASLDRLDLRPLLRRLLEWPQAPAHAGEAAAWFHLSLAQGLADWAAAAAATTGSGAVCLGGGCFFNALLHARVTQRLQQHGLRVLAPRTVSCGDAGLALGQAWIAAHVPQRAAAQGCTQTRIQVKQEEIQSCV
jgi:hydrogenase maturation protein HypF